jgi:hypothetical protein
MVYWRAEWSSLPDEMQLMFSFEAGCHRWIGALSMRTLSLLAFGLLGVAALGAIPGQLACEPKVAGSCGDILWLALLFLLGFCGLILLLVAMIMGIIRTRKRHQWGWLLGLCVGTFVPLPVMFLVAGALTAVYGPDALQPLLPLVVGLLLTPVTVLVYSVRYPTAPRMSVAT